MTKNVLSAYSQSPYTVIGLESTDNSILTTFNDQNSNEIKYIANNVDDCEQFITKHEAPEKIILVVSSHISGDESARLQKYLQLDAIYSYYRQDDSKEEFICIYKKKEEEGKYKHMFSGLLENLWFLIGVIIVIIVAYLWPNVGATNGPLKTQYTVKMGCVFFIFLLSSLSLPLKYLAEDVKNYRLHLCTQFYSFFFVSFVFFCVALLLDLADLNTVLVTGMILLGCMPTSNSINIIATKYCNGNEAGTLLNIIFGTVIGTVLSPALIIMYMAIDNTGGQEQSFDLKTYGVVFATLALTILLPIVIGQIITYFWTEQMMTAKKRFHFAEITVVLLLLVVWAVLCDVFQGQLLRAMGASDILLVILFIALLFVIFLLIALFIAVLPDIFICLRPGVAQDQQPLLQESQLKSPTLAQRWRFSHGDAITFMFCGSTKTLSFGVPLITALYPTASAGYIGLVTLPLALYDVEQIIITSIAIIILQRYYPAPPEDTEQQKF